MKSAEVVIGANFGDEGKGLVTDYLASVHGKDAVVLRFNGGAQAGHTVVTPDGRRHVFSHFGSGTLAGSASYLSRFFVVHPMLFLRELEELRGLGADPLVFVHPDSLVTTPYDIMINQFAESARGVDRHGSCGLGFGAAVERNFDSRYALALRDLFDRDRVVSRLRAMRQDYLPARLAAMGIRRATKAQTDLVASEDILERWLLDVAEFLALIEVAGDRVLRSARHLIFEGAQGLLLDQQGRFFPHLTRSNTGLRNVLSVAGDLGVEALDVTYVTRAYLTRHGAGPLPGEIDQPPCPGMVDETNVTNAWQGSLRFAPLDLDLLGETIRADLGLATGGFEIRHRHRLAVTCLDQVGTEIDFIRQSKRQRADIGTLVATAAAAAGSSRLLLAAGPTRDDIQPCRAEAIAKQARCSFVFA